MIEIWIEIWIEKGRELKKLQKVLPNSPQAGN